jgi:predicted  nucleic acid-binding Zn-ribbon protein
MLALDVLNSKIELLLRKYAALEAENKRLKEAMAQQEKTVDSLRKQLGDLENGMVSVHIGKAIDDAGEKENMRRQLDNVISEIDKILNTLND